MTVRELLQLLFDHAVDGRGAGEQVLIRCDGELREVAAVETRIEATPDADPDLFVLVVADGLSTTVEASSMRRPPQRP